MCNNDDQIADTFAKRCLRDRHKMKKPKQFEFKTRNRRLVLNNKIALVNSLKLYGFASADTLAAAVKTHSGEEINSYMKRRMQLLRYWYRNTLKPQKVTAPMNANEGIETFENRSTAKEEKSLFNNLTVSEIQEYPYLEQWKQIALHVMTTSCKDDSRYSEVLSDLFQKFGGEEEEEEEEEDCNDPDTPNFKALYNSFGSMLAGRVPPMQRPIDSMLFCQLMADLTCMIRCGAKEEKEYMKNYKGPVKFVLSPTVASTSKGSSCSLDIAAEQMSEKMPGTKTEKTVALEELFYAIEEIPLPENMPKINKEILELEKMLQEVGEVPVSDSLSGTFEKIPTPEKVPVPEIEKIPASGMPDPTEQVFAPEVLVNDAQLYEDFQKHLKICEDLNPLGIPISLLQLRQEKLAKYMKLELA